MENKQLASYWIAEKVGILIENLLKGYYKNQESFDADWHNLFNHAGEMEKDQIMKANFDGFQHGVWVKDESQVISVEQYYNETYGKE